MLLICQSVSAVLRGNHPFLRATVTSDGTPPSTPHCSEDVTFSIRFNAYCRSGSVNSLFGCASKRSRVIWSTGVVVVRPHPGQGNPGHSTHAEGVVLVSPAVASNEPSPDVPPASSQRFVAASLSLSSIIVCANGCSETERPCPPESASSVSRILTLTMLASSWGVSPPNVQVWPVSMSKAAAVIVPSRLPT